MESLPISLLVLSILLHTSANLIASTEPVEPTQPLKPGDYDSTTPNTVPAFPVQRRSPHNTCQLDLSDELFGGVNQACSNNHTLDRSRCCPVLAAWLFAAHARSALQISPSPSSSPSPSPGKSPSTLSEASDSDLLPMMPDDSQRCVNSLQTSLQKRNIVLAQPNSTCDTILCFCGIRLHQITSLKCSAAFNVTPSAGHWNATPTAAVKNLEKSCRNSSYSGCTKCLGALQKLKGDGKSSSSSSSKIGSRMNKMLNKDCQLMGLTWLLARNKTEYIPTVSAVLRALMYSSHTHESMCSPDQENMPLAVDSLQFDKSAADQSSATATPVIPLVSSMLVIFLFVLFLLLGDTVTCL